MSKKKKKPLFVRLFPTSPIMRLIAVLCLFLGAILMVQNVYYFYQLKQQEMALIQERDKLLSEKQELEEKKESLQQDETVEKKARDELGLVKSGEVPYVR
ncbi:MAG: cell division protein FtsL [Dialister sp.]|nr:cell division protein FtsL [Dialister sp.]